MGVEHAQGAEGWPEQGGPPGSKWPALLLTARLAPGNQHRLLHLIQPKHLQEIVLLTSLSLVQGGVESFSPEG